MNTAKNEVEFGWLGLEDVQVGDEVWDTEYHLSWVISNGETYTEFSDAVGVIERTDGVQNSCYGVRIDYRGPGEYRVKFSSGRRKKIGYMELQVSSTLLYEGVRKFPREDWSDAKIYRARKQ